MAKKQLALEVMPTVHVASLLHQQFQQLSCYDKVIGLLKAGFSLEHIRSIIQDVNQEWIDVPQPTVVERLSKLKHELSSVDLVAPYLPGYVETAAKEVEDGLNELAEMKELFEIQKNRIMISYSMEQKLKILNKNTGFEVRLGKDILESSAALKARVGIAGHAPAPEVQRNVAVPAKLGDPKGSNKILKAVQLLMKAAE